VDASTYVLDANVFIEAARHYYAFDLRTPFWDILVRRAEDGVIGSIDRVKQELDRGKDELAEWANERFADAFHSTDEEDITKNYREVMTWVQGQAQFLEAAKAEFASGADGWLVAYAMAKGCIVVTHEQPQPDVRTRVPIPNICHAFGVRYVDTFKMLRELRVQFT
jgi:hypothetical protein